MAATGPVLRLGAGRERLGCWLRALSSVGRAPARQAGGHWFEPSSAHLTPASIRRHAWMLGSNVTSSADAPKPLYISQDFGRSLYLTEYTAAHVWQPIRGGDPDTTNVIRGQCGAYESTLSQPQPLGGGRLRVHARPNPRQAGSGRERSLGARLVRLLLDVRGLDSREFDLCGGPSPAPAHDEFESMATWARSRQERVDGVRRVLPIDEPTHLRRSTVRFVGIGHGPIETHAASSDERLAVARGEDRNLGAAFRDTQTHQFGCRCEEAVAGE